MQRLASQMHSNDRRRAGGLAAYFSRLTSGHRCLWRNDEPFASPRQPQTGQGTGQVTSEMTGQLAYVRQTGSHVTLAPGCLRTWYRHVASHT